MSTSDELRKYQLECLRQAADCKYLSEEAETEALRAHFLKMSEMWNERATGGPEPESSVDFFH